MPLLEIDGRLVKVTEGSTILDAACKLGVYIPLMCFMEGYGHFTSCMICVVKEKVSNRLLPACSAPVSEGMVVDTESREVTEARRDALELLLKEHIGDCLGPCNRACPAQMDIPAALRLAEAGKIAETGAAFKNTTLFPAILGRICRAPCENACRRGHYDSPVSVKLLERLSGDRYLSDFFTERVSQGPLPVIAQTGKKVAVIGSGPAGLSASFYLSRRGHAVTVFEKRVLPGGMLRYEIGEEKLPRRVLDSEIDSIISAGLLLRLSTEVGVDVSMDELNQSYNAVVIASGDITRCDPGSFGVKMSDSGIRINRSGFETDKRGVFACGGAVRPLRMAARSVFEGRSAAFSIDLFLNGRQPSGLPKTFNSVIGKLKEGEIGEFLKEASESTAY